MSYLMLIMNLGATSTKMSIYRNLDEVVKVSVNHSSKELSNFKSIWDQQEFRKETVVRVTLEKGYEISDFDIIVSRGGNMKPVPSGIYQLSQEMIDDMKTGRYGIHPTCVGNATAFELGQEYGIPAIIADPPISDEFMDIARFSGIKELPRISSGHVLNQKRTARKIAFELGKKYEDMNFIVGHLGGGVSVGTHRKGKLIDMNNALDGEGPFSSERSGTIIIEDVLNLAYSGNYSREEASKYFKGNGGLVSYLGTNSGLEVEKMIESGDEQAKLVYDAMAYQIAKEIGASAAALKGEVDAIAITGGLGYSKTLIEEIKQYVSFIATVYVVPGENEMISLAESALRFLKGEEKAKSY